MTGREGERDVSYILVYMYLYLWSTLYVHKTVVRVEYGYGYISAPCQKIDPIPNGVCMYVLRIVPQEGLYLLIEQNGGGGAFIVI